MTDTLQKPITPKQFADKIGRGVGFVYDLIAGGNLPTCPPHRMPYLIPFPALVKFLNSETTKKKK